MLLHYKSGVNSYSINIHWTADTGCSAVFQDIVQKVSDRHLLDPGSYHELAKQLDDLTDKLYEQIYIFTDEHFDISYNPRFRRYALEVFSEISGLVQECLKPDAPEPETLFVGLFMNVVDKLRETMNVYLADNTYQDKYRYRRRKLEQSTESIHEVKEAYEFEDVILQMTDLSRLLDCLTDTQRTRLVKHIFLKYTMQEIAAQEKTNGAVVYRSITASLKKLRQRLTP